MSGQSGEEDTELRDLVSQTLENNGVLAKIRAELRASVFLALEDHDSSQSRQKSHNKALRRFLHTTEGVIAASVVREFLEFFKLEYTLTVFDQEAYCQTEYCPSSKFELRQQLGVEEGTEKLPVLAKLLQKQSLNIPEDIEDEPVSAHKLQGFLHGNISGGRSHGLEYNEYKHSQKESMSLSPEPGFSREGPSEHRNHDSVPAVNDTFTFSPDPLTATKQPAQDENSVVNLTETIKRLDTSNHTQSGTTAMEHKPLGLLPPLKSPAELQENANRRLERIKKMWEIDSPSSSLENYEEDFQSSVSGSQKETTEEPKVAAASVSEEIEEAVSEVQSSASLPLEELAQDLTCDTSISLKLALPADYLEDV